MVNEVAVKFNKEFKYNTIVLTNTNEDKQLRANERANYTLPVYSFLFCNFCLPLYYLLCINITSVATPVPPMPILLISRFYSVL